MYDYDTGHFYLDYQGKVVYDLMIRKPFIQVSGQTSAGKSMLINLIKVLDIKGVIAFTNIEELPFLKRQLIIVEDYLLTPDIVEYIAHDRGNNYIVFSRKTLDLKISPNYYGDFVCTNNKITIEYEFSEKGWF